MISRNYFGFVVTISLVMALGQSFEWSSSEEDSYEGTPMLKVYRRCLFDQDKYFPKRLIHLSMCSNMFCDSDLKTKSGCLDILPDDCEEISDEEDIVHKPYPTCCPIYCKLKKRMERVKSTFIRHRLPPHAFET
ncbi:hypothetical protein ACFFRR_004393 [Megaselia abdita]